MEDIPDNRGKFIPVNYSLQFDDGRVLQVTQIKYLASGGSKSAWDIGNGLVLMLPSSFLDDRRGFPILQDGKGWQMVVYEEIFMSNKMKAQGLITTDNTKVVVTKLPDGNDEPSHEVLGFCDGATTVTSYVATSFESMKSQGRFVMDHKNDESSTWKGSVFSSDTDLSNPEIWKPVLKEFIHDAVKRCICGYPGRGDSLSYCIELVDDQYRLRALSFDFSTMRIKEQLTDDLRSEIREDTIHGYLESGIEAVLFCEKEYRLTVDGKRPFMMCLGTEFHDIRKKVSTDLLPFASDIVHSFPGVKYITLEEERLAEERRKIEHEAFEKRMAEWHIQQEEWRIQREAQEAKLVELRQQRVDIERQHEEILEGMRRKQQAEKDEQARQIKERDERIETARREAELYAAMPFYRKVLSWIL